MSRPDPNLFVSEFFEATPVAQNPEYPDGYDISFLLPSSFKSIDMWASYLESLAKVFNLNIHIPTEALSMIRLPEAQARVYKALHSQMMGYLVPDEIMTDEAYDRLNTHVGYYGHAQGRDSFFRFLAFVLGVKLDVVRLWTQDYREFYPGHGKPVYEGGTWYPTTHVGVVYDTDNNPLINEQHIIDLFYEHAPCDLVLKWLAKSQTVFLGKIYLGIFSKMDVSLRFNLNLQDELIIRIFMQVFTANDDYLRFDLLCGRGDLSPGICTQLVSYIESVHPIRAEGFYWKAGRPNPQTSRFVFSRPTEAFTFTTTGGEWSTVNAPRFGYVSPIDGTTGLLIEKESANYVRSSTDMSVLPWNASNARKSVDFFGALDGTDQWQFNSMDGVNPATIKQQVVLYPETYTFQAIFNGDMTVLLASSFADVVGLPAPMPAVTTTVMTNGWTLATLTFTLAETSNVDIVFSCQGIGRIFYAGIEQGTIATSPIRTNDCNVGVRASDNFTLRSVNYESGTVGLRMLPAMSAYSVQVPVSQHTLRGIDGNQREAITLAEDSTGLKTANLAGELYPYTPFVATSPFSAQARFAARWGNVANIQLDGGVLTAGLEEHPTRFVNGPRWTGFVTGMLLMPFLVDNTLLNDLGV